MSQVSITTDYPIALDSIDRLFPLGAANDDTRHPPFLSACKRICGDTYSLLDIGCAGGGLVADALEDGNFAVGVDGAEAAARMNWRAHPGNYFHCDVRYPFTILLDGEVVKFDVVSAWEFLEHIETAAILEVLRNVKSHLKEGGWFVSSIATEKCHWNGHEYHKTVEGKRFWEDKFTEAGLKPCDSPFSAEEYARSDYGLHIVARAS